MELEKSHLERQIPEDKSPNIRPRKTKIVCICLSEDITCYVSDSPTTVCRIADVRRKVID